MLPATGFRRPRAAGEVDKQLLAGDAAPGPHWGGVARDAPRPSRASGADPRRSPVATGNSSPASSFGYSPFSVCCCAAHSMLPMAYSGFGSSGAGFFNAAARGRARRLAGDGKGLTCPLRGDVVEASTVAVEHRLLASKLLPALHRNIDISRRDFNRVAHAAGHLSRDYRRARAAERLVDGLPGRRIILDRAAHALDRLLRAVAGFR